MLLNQLFIRFVGTIINYFNYVLKNYVITSFFIGFSFLSFSQHKYAFEVESLNDKQPKEVFDEFSQHLEEYDKHIEDGVFFLNLKSSTPKKILKKLQQLLATQLKSLKSPLKEKMNKISKNKNDSF